MDINHLISQYGYAALIVGSMAEGETITLLGGVAAHQGLLKFPLYVNRENHDLKDLRRVPKKSYAWLKQVFRSNGEAM